MSSNTPLLDITVYTLQHITVHITVTQPREKVGGYKVHATQQGLGKPFSIDGQTLKPLSHQLLPHFASVV